MATQTRIPTGDGATAQHSVLSGTTRWEMVDDNAAGDPVGAADDDTSYIYRTANNATTTFTCSAFSISASAIEKVSVTYRRQNATGSSFDRAILTVNGVGYEDTSQATPSAYGDRTRDWTTNPGTLAAWTEADVNGTGPVPIQGFGVRNIATADGEWRCTQVYMTVTYTESVGGGGANPRPRQRRMMMGMG